MRTSGIRFAAAGFLVMAALLAACSAAHVRPGAQSRAGARAPAPTQGAAGVRLRVSRGPWWSRGVATPCAPPGLVRTAGHVMGVGTCTGKLSKPPLQVTMPVGQRIDVHMTGAGLARLPHSSFPAVLAPGGLSQDRATQTYHAARPGHAVLISDARACLVLRHREVKEVPGSCPMVAVTVVP